MANCTLDNTKNEGGIPDNEIEKTLESKNSSPDDPTNDVLELKFYDHKQLKTMATNEKESSNNLVWKNHFKEFNNEHCFLLSYAGKYPQTDHMTALGTHEENDKEYNNIRCIKAFICSTDENALEMCSNFVKKLVEESDTELAVKAKLSCGHCFLYNNNNMQSFDSVVTCLKEFARIVKEMKAVENNNDRDETMNLGWNKTQLTDDCESGDKFSNKKDINKTDEETKIHNSLHSTMNIDNFVSYQGKNIPRNESISNGMKTVLIGTKTTKDKGKVVVLLGTTGSGKTSLINLCANYYFGSQIVDDEKLFIVESKGKTDMDTIYTFYPNQEPQIPLTVIDLPGLNVSSGDEIHDHVNELKLFFAIACSQGLEINAIGFVGQSHLVRLTSAERLVMNCIKTFFGAEVERHIIALVTFSDSDQTPCFVTALEDYGFKKPTFFKFNNTLLMSKDQKVDAMDRLNWKMGKRSWKNFIRHLNAMDSIPYAFVSKIHNDVFNKEIHDRYIINLIYDVQNLIEASNDNKLFRIEELHVLLRKHVWIAATAAYNINERNFGKTKEIFLIEFCQLHFYRNLKSFPGFILFLLMDDESTMHTTLMTIFTTLLQYVNFDTSTVNRSDNECTSSNVSKKDNLWETNCGKLKTLNQCAITSPSVRMKIFQSASQLIRKEISKYSPMFVSWDLALVIKEFSRNKRVEERNYVHIAEELIKANKLF